MKAKKILILIAAILIVSSLQAKTFHVIGIFDTDDGKIGKGIKSEMQIMKDKIGFIREHVTLLGYKLETHYLSGSDCCKETLIQTVNAVSVSSDDVVFFYYGGHGARAMNDPDPFPQMCLGSVIQSKYVPATKVKNMIMAKNPRLLIMMTGCCNKESPYVQPKDTEFLCFRTRKQRVALKAVKKLFIEPRGVVMMTSSVQGEYSWITPKGSFFALALWDAITRSGEGALSPNWKEICREVQRQVSTQPIYSGGETYSQNPYYEIKLDKY